MSQKPPVLRFALIAVFAALVLALVPTAFADRGGGHGGGKPGGGGSATLTLSPNPVASGAAFQGTGCGYTVGKQVNVVIDNGSSQAFFPTGVNASGCIMFSWWASAPGTETISTYQSGNGGKQSLMARRYLTVI